MAEEERVTDNRFVAEIEADLAAIDQMRYVHQPTYSAELEEPVVHQAAAPNKHRLFFEGQERREKILELVAAGMTVAQCIDAAGIQERTYYGYRSKYPKWAAKIDAARLFFQDANKAGWDGSSATFIWKYFRQRPTWFHLLILKELEKTAPGDMLLVLVPPEHGKTTTFENYASMKLALRPAHRFLVVSENQSIAKKICGRVMDRMNPLGPAPEYVRDYGPFTPQTGGGLASLRQPWTDGKFRVYKARTADERNFSMEAVGANGSIVSARTDHLAIDDIQSLKTLGQTTKATNWIRQDALSRPGETGITSIMGTRVGEEDVYAELLADDDLADIMRVVRFPAIITDHDTGAQRPLWEKSSPDDPVGHTMESLDRMKKKAGQEVWDRNWMQDPGKSRVGKGTFTQSMIDNCKDATRSMEHHVGDEGERSDAPVYILVDPALGGKNVVMAVEVLPGNKMLVRRSKEDVGFVRNEQIMEEIRKMVVWCNLTGIVTDIVIEDKNFQLGLKNDDRLIAMASKHGFNIRGHNTGWSKYDPDIGIPSMASSFIKKEIVLAWAEDDMTRREIGRLESQLKKWKPGIKGNKLRQDYVMCLWFGWMLWRSRDKSDEGLSNAGGGFQRDTGAWQMNDQGIMVPRGVA